jgi:hypothetical protein
MRAGGRADGQTDRQAWADMTKLNGIFRDYANTPDNDVSYMKFVPSKKLPKPGGSTCRPGDV